MPRPATNSFEYKTQQLTREISAIKRLNVLRSFGTTVFICIGAPIFLIGSIIVVTGTYLDSARTLGGGIATTFLGYSLYRFWLYLTEAQQAAGERLTQAMSELDVLVNPATHEQHGA